MAMTPQYGGEHVSNQHVTTQIGSVLPFSLPPRYHSTKRARSAWPDGKPSSRIKSSTSALSGRNIASLHRHHFPNDRLTDRLLQQANDFEKFHQLVARPRCCCWHQELPDPRPDRSLLKKSTWLCPAGPTARKKCNLVTECKHLHKRAPSTRSIFRRPLQIQRMIDVIVHPNGILLLTPYTDDENA